MRTAARSIDRDIGNSREERRAHPIDDTDSQNDRNRPTRFHHFASQQGFPDRDATVDSIGGASVRIEDDIDRHRFARVSAGPAVGHGLHASTSTTSAPRISAAWTRSRGLDVGNALLRDAPLQSWRSDRCAGSDGHGPASARGERGLQDLHAIALRSGEPCQRSGRQAQHENLVNQSLRR
ncbi:hypothetical protein LDO31_06195 [Luteimonas sp. XNQY3]|nr:hypothetical protein [Luteimonas sp. XNQY3]MCD9005832.1 hypothetical protein [Luteimonas sp. XNQY3]